MASWTWLIYMAGDNNLEGAGRADLQEMQAAGSTAQVNIIVQFDTEANRTVRLRVLRNKLKILAEMPGVDCGDPKVLRDFIRWGSENFPARQYLLDVWNHGGGWENLPADYDYEALRQMQPRKAARLGRVRRSLFRTTVGRISRLPVEAKAIAIDCGSHDYLDNQELQQAIEGSLPDNGVLDVVGCDACLMNMLEIAYQLRGGTRWLVGSEETEPAEGWPYREILSRLIAEPSMAGPDLAKTIVEEYIRSYQSSGEAATQSALDLANVTRTCGALDELAEALLSKIKENAPGISLARESSQKFEMPEYIDLGDFCKNISRQFAGNERIRAAAAKVIKTLKIGGKGSLVLANATAGRNVSRASGVSIYFPRRELYSPDYRSLDYSRDGSWRRLLEGFFDVQKRSKNI